MWRTWLQELWNALKLDKWRITIEIVGMITLVVLFCIALASTRSQFRTDRAIREVEWAVKSNRSQLGLLIGELQRSVVFGDSIRLLILRRQEMMLQKLDEVNERQDHLERILEEK